MSGDTNLTPADIYREQHARYMHMNDLFHRMLPLSATIVGGLWYFAAQYIGKEKIVASGALIFACAVALTFAVAMSRYLVALTLYMKHLDKMDGHLVVDFHPSDRSELPRMPKVIPKTGTAIVSLMVLAATMSLAGAVYVLAVSR